MIKVITTVGTSLFTNYMREEVEIYLKDVTDDGGIREEFKKLENEADANAVKHIKRCIVPHWIQNIKQEPKDDKGKIKYVQGAGLNISCCAEVQTIETIKKEIIKKKDYEIILLTTHTPLSELAGNIIKESIYLKENETRCPIPVKGLDVNKSDTFNDDGFKALFDEVVKIQDENKNDQLVLNISGGYKGIIPIITLIGQLLNIEIVYMYENSTTLIRIAKLPINFDTTLLEGVASYMNDEYLADISSNSDVYKLFDDYKLLNTDGDKTKMSGVGKVLHKALFKGNLSNSILGTFIEYKLFHYFITALEDEPYCKPQMVDDSKCFKIENGKYIFQDIPLNKNGNEQIPNGFRRLGDLDIVLNSKKVNRDILCEVKSHFQVANTFYNDMNNEKDYYPKIKARIEYWLSKNPHTEFTFLFIIHKIKILEGDSSSITDERIIEVINYFAENVANEYQGKISFEVRGVWIDTRKKEILVNYTELFRKPILHNDWEFLLSTPKI